jgi:hypothetical protein
MALENIPVIFFTWPTSQVDKLWLKGVTANIPNMVLTRDTSQLERFWLTAGKGRKMNVLDRHPMV